VGFAGVLVIIRPGSHAFHPAIFLSVMNAFLYAGFNMLTRRLAASENPVSTQLFSAAVSAVVLAPFAWSQWQTPEGVLTWVIIGLIGVFAGLGHLSVASAHRYASAAFLGPFLYQQILYMTLGGWLVFGQTPDHTVALGAVIVVASGMFLLWREMRTKVSSTL
jgi:drug/metabolite transporter (DMT)-like permease